ncbi:MAG TPA: ATP-binding protein, partial [bacterium]|nr:ATP-binding protein [bacterium]
VVLAGSGDEGLVLHRQQPAQVIILDLKMPEKDGLQTLEELRHLDREVPVIILTGYGTMEAARKAIHLGAVEFLTKPFDIEEMRQLVRKAVEKRVSHLAAARLTEELTALNRQLQEKLTEMEKLSTLGLLSVEILHEINNPLTVIQGFTQLLLQEMAGEEHASPVYRQYLQTIEEEIQRCQILARNILDYSREKPAFQPVNLNEILVKIVGFLQQSKMGRAAVFQLNLARQLPLLYGDPHQLHQAYLNIFLNSLQASHPERSLKISVSSRSENDWIVTSLSDNGKGIPEEDLPHIFQPFFTQGKTGGTGLGLSLTRKIISLHQGRIEVASRLDQGTTFTIFLPAGRANSGVDTS